MTKPQALHIRGAHIHNESIRNRYDERDLYTTDVVVAERPKDALTVDLSGYTIFPGLINAHDHLELNHYPRTKFRDHYDNASQWSVDMNAHLNESPFKELRAYPLEDRCFIGGLKNLLCGATTVAHHNPPHKCLFRSDFPVRVLKKYGWAHSLYLSSDEEIIASYKRTPPDVPWFIHLAEGTDEAAAGEYKRLKALGCVGSNTVIVHGVGLTTEDIADAAPSVRGLVWCRTTNHYLLGKTLDPIEVFVGLRGHLAMGSDSRLTADGDLLDERHFDVFPTYEMHPRTYQFLMLEEASKIISVPQAGNLSANAYADFIALKQMEFLVLARRADLALVVRGGIPQIGDPDVMAKFSHIETVRARLDDKEKSINVTLAWQIARCTLQEPGLELLEPPNETSFNRVWNGVWKR